MEQKQQISTWWYIYAIALLLSLNFSPLVAKATQLETAVWIPWWSEESGVESAIKNIRKIDVIYPFVYEVDSLGRTVNRVDFEDPHWDELIKVAKKKKVDIIPTVAWFDGKEIHSVLSNSTARKQHIEDIVKQVKKYNFKGVNIDYESKLGETIDYYSLFLKELNEALGKKHLTCTIEARTPPESKWREVPKVIQYANDYKAINKHCDWVEIMAYDQQRADLKLNDARKGLPYMPVADMDWVEKVLDLALKDIDRDKIMLGIPTYGRAWDITVAPDWYRDYQSVASLNHPQIIELSKKYQAPIGRSVGGEAVISYFPDTSPWRVFNALPTPPGTPAGYESAAKALMVATYANIEIPVRFVTWSDSTAINDKVKLAQRHNLRGIAVFKVDGEEDPKMWSVLP